MDMNEMSENKGVKEVTEVKKGKRQESSGERWLIAAAAAVLILVIKLVLVIKIAPKN